MWTVIELHPRLSTSLAGKVPPDGFTQASGMLLHLMTDSSSLLGLSKEACSSIKTTVEPYAFEVINTMSSNTSVQNSNSPSANMKAPISHARRMACTHLTMRRFYGESRCPICRRDPDLGYTYLCTQDESEDVSCDIKTGIPEAIGDTATIQSQSPEGEASGNKMKAYADLSPWIQKAIAEGEYSVEQITMLRAQKQKVVETITAAIEQAKENDIPDQTKSFRSKKLSPVDPNSRLPFTFFYENPGTPTTQPVEQEEKTAPRLFPYCEFRACQTCRPTFRDRTWQKFEDVFADTITPTIDFANDNRPLSSPFIIAGIGQHEPSSPRESRNFDSFSLYRPERPLKRAYNDIGDRGRSETAQSNDITDQRPEPESRGFRDSVKRAFRGMLMSRRDSMSSKASTRSSRLMRRKMRVREEESSDDIKDFDMGLWKELNDELLNVASNVKLPGHDGMDGLEAQEKEVEVGDGVAVMEESVDMGTADIIMAL